MLLKLISLFGIFQIKLNLKMFPEKIVPYLNSLKHDKLQVMNHYIGIN